MTRTNLNPSFEALWSGSPTVQSPTDAADFYIPLIIVFGGNALFFIFCQIKKDNSYIDAYWGISFLLPLVGLLIKRYAQAGKPDPDARCWVVVACVAIWAVRLCFHIL